jgi:hypothetical protein
VVSHIQVRWIALRAVPQASARGRPLEDEWSRSSAHHRVSGVDEAVAVDDSEAMCAFRGGGRHRG